MKGRGKKVSFVCVGKKGLSTVKKDRIRSEKVIKKPWGISRCFNAREIATDLADNFLNGTTDKVEILFGEFQSVARQVPDGWSPFCRFNR